MVNKLIVHGYVDVEFENEIISRENMSDSFWQFMIPHAMKMHAKKDRDEYCYQNADIGGTSRCVSGAHALL